MGEKKVCPLYYSGGRSHCECMKEKCALWNEEAQCCAYKAISDSLRRIARKV